LDNPQNSVYIKKGLSYFRYRVFKKRDSGGVMDSNDEIAKVAYELFERDGRQHGKDKEHWTEAERIVKAKRMERDAERDRKVAAPKKTSAKGGTASKKEKTPKSGEAGAAKQSKKPSSRASRSK